MTVSLTPDTSDLGTLNAEVTEVVDGLDLPEGADGHPHCPSLVSVYPHAM